MRSMCALKPAPQPLVVQIAVGRLSSDFFTATVH